MKKKAAFFTAIPAFLGFILLFAANFLLVFVSVAAVSVGLLTTPVGGLSLLGFLSVASDLTPPALTASGFFCVFAGLWTFFIFMRFALFSMRLVHDYAGFLTGKRSSRPVRSFSGRKLLWFFLAISIFFLACTVILQTLAVKNGYNGSVVRETLEFEKAKYLTISTTNMDFDVKPWDGDMIKLEYVNDSKMLIRQTDENYLKLTQDDSFTLSLFSFDILDYKMTLYLPENDYREIYLSSSSGSITLLETQSEYTEISTRSGSVGVDEASGKLNITTFDGDVSVRYVAFVNAAIINNASGRTEVVMPDFSGVTLNFLTVTGHLTSDMFNEPYENEQGNVTAAHSAPLNHFLSVNTEDGDLILRKE